MLQRIRNHSTKTSNRVGLLAPLLLCAICSYYSCERDDICSDSTQKTALMTINFLDIDDDTVDKAVPSLQVQVLNAKEADFVTPETAVDLTTITLPLDTTKDTTTFYLTYNSGITENDISIANTDTLSVVYERNYAYINRACGYNVIFDKLNEIKEERTEDQDWIKEVFVEKTTVDLNEEVHITIRH